MSLWTWIIPLQILAVGFLVAEVFLPSAGILIALMIGSTGLSVWLAFQVSQLAGLLVLAADLLILPIAGWMALSKVPSTPAALRDQLDGKAGDDRLTAFVGQIGICETAFRPVGRVRIGSEIIEAQALHGFLEQGVAVHVTRLEGGHLFVEAT